MMLVDENGKLSTFKTREKLLNRENEHCGRRSGVLIVVGRDRCGGPGHRSPRAPPPSHRDSRSHDNGGSHHHDHELNAPLTVTRTQNSVHLQVVVSQTNDLDDSVFELVSHSNRGHSESRDLGPPVYLMHCVSLT